MFQTSRRAFHPGAFALVAALLTPVMPQQPRAARHHSEPPAHRPAGAPGDNKIDPVLKEAIRTAPSAAQLPNDNCVRLLDLGTVTVRSDGTTVAEFRTTYKLFNSNARELAEVRLPYNSSYQDLHVLSARTIKKDGTVVPVDPAGIRVGGIAGEDLMYDDALAANFSMPAVEDDCVIDYTWQEITHPNLMPGQFMNFWGFSDTMPVSVSRYVLHVPTDKPLRWKNYNDDRLQPIVTSSVDGHTKTYTWELKDIKPIEIEPSMPSVSEVRSWIEVTSLGSWQDVAHWFSDLQRPQARANAAIKAQVAALTVGKTTDEDRARAIYDWVAGKTRYVGLEFGISAYKPHAAPDVFHNLYGDCKDKANLLITMLAQAGIKAHPVLLHAGERRPLADGLPTLTAFNHCITLAEVGGKEVWLDATAETCAYGDIPGADRGVQALVVNGDTGDFRKIPTYSADNNGMDVATEVIPAQDGAAHATAEITLQGDVAQTMRAEIRLVPPNKRKEVIQKIAERIGLAGTVKEFTLPDGIDNSGPYRMKVTLDMPNYGKASKKHGGLLQLPLRSAVSGAPESSRSNPYVADTRVWPIVSEDTSHLQTRTTVTLPVGYAIDELPDDADLTGPLQEYHRKVIRATDGKSVTITEIFTDHTGKAPASDYSKIRSFWSDLIKSFDDEITLKKIL